MQLERRGEAIAVIVSAARTWMRDGSGLATLTQNTVIAAVTTHPSQPPFDRGIRKGSIFGRP